jgi:hypothetical protein
LCANHHKVVDTDLKTYTVKELREMKYFHETRRFKEFSISDRLAERIALAMGGVAAGTISANLAREAAPYIGAIFNALPKMTLERLSRLLRTCPRRGVCFRHLRKMLSHMSGATLCAAPD